MAKNLGKGISRLLENVEDQRGSGGERVYKIPLTHIEPNPNQPRKDFNEKALGELAESIREHGIIQPIVVKNKGNKFLIVAGERRFRAAMMLGLNEMPVIIKELSDQKTREVSLIENLQREDLNAIEAAQALKELMGTHKLTQEELARRIGKSRSGIANTMRLLLLDTTVQQLVREDKLSAGHARTLIPITKKEDQIRLANETVNKGLSVREVEKKVRYYLHPEKEPKKMNEEQKKKFTKEMKSFVDDMKRIFMTKVKIMGNEKKGRISIDYYTKDDLQRIYELIKGLE
ncbi:MAG: ParB/RepB/Spo0J family partition protein [Bacillota bacterium]